MSTADVWRQQQRDAYVAYSRDGRRQPHVGGGDDWKQMTKRVFLALALFVVGWAALSTAFDAANAYRAARIDRFALLEKAKNYYNDPKSMCSSENAQYRVSVGAYFDRCEEAQRIINENPNFEALIVVLEKWKFCSAGQCMVFSMNIFDSLGLIVGTAFVLISLLGLLLLAIVLRMIYRNFETSHALPLYANPLAQAAYEKREMGTNEKWD